jgi:heat shock protein HtpX
MKRILLFLATNIAVLVVISIILKVLNIQPYLQANGLNYQSLLAFSAVVGFSGSIISLLMSRFIAKQAYSIKIINQPSNNTESWLVHKIGELSRKLNFGMPEVGIYDSPDPNAFATGWSRNNSLVAVSTGLLNSMSPDELEGVLGHEMSHIANGDMVTMTLLQGVVNTFVVFFSRIAAMVVMQFFRRNGDSNDSRMGEGIYFVMAMIFQILFGILASMIVMWFSRYREFRADAGSAKYVGKDKMISALKRLQAYVNAPEDPRGPEFKAMKISDKPNAIMALLSSHPPLEARIAALQKQ